MNRWHKLGMSGLALVSLGALTACEHEHHHHRAVYNEPAVVYAEPAPVGGVYYEYYPDVEVYFEPGRHVYWWREHDVWRTGPAVPPGIRLRGHVRVTTPEPWRHHDEIIRRYPRNWRAHERHEDKGNQRHD